MLTLFASQYKPLGYDKTYEAWKFQRLFPQESEDYELLIVRRAKLVDKCNLRSTVYDRDGTFKRHAISLYSTVRK